jgi:hypothetical protein
VWWQELRTSEVSVALELAEVARAEAVGGLGREEAAHEVARVGREVGREAEVVRRDALHDQVLALVPARRVARPVTPPSRLHL